MPEMTFTVRWPDGVTQECYSPSLVMHDFLVDGSSYPIDEFMLRTTAALTEASERVKARYGFYCTSAAAQIDALRKTRDRYDRGDVTVTSMAPNREVLT